MVLADLHSNTLFFFSVMLELIRKRVPFFSFLEFSVIYWVWNYFLILFSLPVGGY